MKMQQQQQWFAKPKLSDESPCLAIVNHQVSGTRYHTAAAGTCSKSTCSSWYQVYNNSTYTDIPYYIRSIVVPVRYNIPLVPGTILRRYVCTRYTTSSIIQNTIITLLRIINHALHAVQIRWLRALLIPGGVRRAYWHYNTYQVLRTWYPITGRSGSQTPS